jgi:polysaccharide export outer membrane protein
MVGLTGCGAIYTSPSVSDGKSGFNLLGEASYNVDVVPLSFETALAANLQPYVPARLPAIFSASGAAPAGNAYGGGAGPTRLPPPLETTPYRIGVADVLLLSANTAEATINDLPGLISAQSKRQGYIVQDDGAIAIPDVGRVRVAGLSMEEAEARIFDSLVEKRFDPTFSLEIAEFNSQRVSVGGSLTSPTNVPITLKPLYL